jgi:DMSO/TMAO reductase YedYZ molybdopterin-dependent catalytic subunit
MKTRDMVTTRRGLLTGLASLGGLAVTGCTETVPPTYGNVLRMGDLLNYRAQRLLLPTSSLAREYDRRDISSVPAIGTTDPSDSKQSAFSAERGPLYDRLKTGGFEDYRLSVEGSVATPRSFSIAELKRFQSRTQITRHMCEEGWTAISEWTGVPLRAVLEACGIRSSARFVTFRPFDEMADSIDMFDALHPQTILAYGMNGRDLPIRHGAPLRVRVEKQLGYKSMKFLHRIVVSDGFEDGGTLGNIQTGWSWYAGI